jgi:hypothetical protein
MTMRAGVAPVAPWVGVALVLLFALHDQFDLVQTRVLILIGLVVAALGIVHRRRDVEAIVAGLLLGIPFSVTALAIGEPLLIGLSQFNFGRFPGPVVVARDLGAENAQLARRLPGYRALVAEFAPPHAARGARLVSWNDGPLVASRCDRPALASTSRPSG